MVFAAACGSIANKSPDASPGIDSHVSVDGPTTDAVTCAANPIGLEGRWRGEMNTNDDTMAHNGTAVGTNLGYAPGKHGFAFLLDGTTNVIAVDDGDALWPAASFSLEAWVKTTSHGNVISKYQCGGYCPANDSQAYYGLSVGGTGAVSFDIRTDASPTIIEATDTLHNVADGNWHHLVGVRDVTAMTAIVYVDGALAVSTNLPTDELGVLSNLDGETDPVVIGGSAIAGAGGYNGFFAGAIDEVSYYTSALSATQVAAIYNAPQGECQ